MFRLIRYLCLSISLTAIASFAVCPSSPWKKGETLQENTYPRAFSEPLDNHIDASWNLHTSAEFLLWVPKEHGLDLSINESLDPELFPSTINPISYDYKPAFKVSLGYLFDFDAWTVNVDYTYFHSSQNGHADYDKGISTLQPIWIVDKGQMCRGRSHWRLNLDMLDALFGRSYYFGERVTLSSLWGVKLLLLNQKYNVLYTTAFGYDNVYSFNSTHTKALGPMTYFETQFLLGHGLSIKTSIMGSIIYQKFHTRLHQSKYDDRTSIAKLHGNGFFQLTPILDTSLGLSWSTNFAKNRWHFDLFGGYEWLYFWNQNSMRKLNDMSTPTIDGELGELMLHGLTLSFKFAF